MKETLMHLKPQIMEIFEHLHTHPEVSLKEFETTKYVTSILMKNNIDVKTFDDFPGVVGEIGEGPFCVGVRADIDALWQQVNGVFCANHSCGHDAHMTIALGTMLLLKELKFSPTGRIKYLFQPAEEKSVGALTFIEKNLIDDIDFLYGVHLRPAEEVIDGQASPAILHGAGQFMYGEIIGEDSHAARPHLGQNAIEIGAALVQELNNIHLNPMVPHSVKMTQFSAGGESQNIIPGYAQFKIDLRAQTNEIMYELRNRVDHIVESLSNLYNVEIKLVTKGEFFAPIVDPEAMKIMQQSICEVLGEENLVPPIITPGGEDFHFYTLKRPQLKATMLGLGCDLKPGLHHPNMTFNVEAILSGIEILAKAVIYTFAHQNNLKINNK
ncbi:M20 peptidase aminoacylase family protein [Bacillus sp. Marseille-P3661]|uniref:M20 peptidase aminoacylase family protein n=1 Tax=Bacillus sp. Marseille-P3661 TaxID=1936234 RepID=UPI000C823E0C|nr:M20 peptidase aminoacylase family protein [Bacillus sp. Marseille-P3661]